MPTLFLTGATGFLGHHLAPLLLQAGHQVRALVRPQSRARLPVPPDTPGLTVVPGDVTSPGTYRTALRGCAAVIHAAGLFRFWGPAAAFERVNHQGTRLLAEAAAEAGVRRFVFVSTLAVIGRPPRGGPIAEDTPCRPQDAYQRSKVAAERALRAVAARSEMEAVILRPGGFYGPGGIYGLNRLLVLDPLRGVRVQVKGGRMHLFPPLFIRDAARGVLLALERGRAGEIYHLCGEPVTLKEANRLVSQMARISPWRWNAPAPLMLALAALLEGIAWFTHREPFYPLNLRHYVFPDWLASNKKAVRELGFTPTPFTDGIRETVAWARQMILPPR